VNQGGPGSGRTNGGLRGNEADRTQKQVKKLHELYPYEREYIEEILRCRARVNIGRRKTRTILLYLLRFDRDDF